MPTRLTAISLALAGAVVFLTPSGADAACGRDGVVVFDAHWCGYCRKVKALLNRHDIDYTVIDTTRNRRARAFMAEHFNTTSVPVTVVDDSFVIGYNKRRLRRLLCLY